MAPSKHNLLFIVSFSDYWSFYWQSLTASMKHVRKKWPNAAAECKLEQSGIWLASQLILGDAAAEGVKTDPLCLESAAKEAEIACLCELKLNRRSGGSKRPFETLGRQQSNVTFAPGEQRKAHLQTHTRTREAALDRQMYPCSGCCNQIIPLVFANVRRRRERKLTPESSARATKPLCSPREYGNFLQQSGAEGILIQLPAAHCLLEINSIRAS